MLDLDAYVARIGYAGPLTPTSATLRALQTHHQMAIPFENLDPFLGRSVALDLAALQAKLVASRRGGYCFEHNTLFAEVLRALGFGVTGLAARVLWMRPADAPPNPRSHMLLMVTGEDGVFLADVGFGGRTVAAPIALDDRSTGPRTPSPLRIVLREGDHVLQTRANAAHGARTAFGERWYDVYRFSLEPQYASDYLVANWFTSTHPESHFRANLIVRRRTLTADVSLMNLRLTQRNDNGTVDEQLLDSSERLARSLVDDFDIEPPAEPSTIFARISATFGAGDATANV